MKRRQGKERRRNEIENASGWPSEKRLEQYLNVCMTKIANTDNKE